MQIIPLQPIDSQTVSCVLNGQSASFNVYQKSTGLYVDVLVSNALIIGGVIAEDRNVIVRNVYLGFIGDVAFIDTQGTSDPMSSSLGSRYQFVYFAPSELPAGVQ